MTTRRARQARRLAQGRAFSAPIDVLVESAGSRNQYGEWVPGKTTVTTTRGASAPVTSGQAADLRDVLPEGTRLSDSRIFWLTTPVQPLRVGDNATDGDRIRYNGIEYRVLRVEDWDGVTEAVCIREDV